MADTVVFRLSSIDQGSVRVYVRYALCYPCDSDEESIKRVAANLRHNLKRGVSYLPIMAGTLTSLQTWHPMAFTLLYSPAHR
jgi:hypothetical protein